ncbi:MAG: Bro-N domain-containing protein [Rickettsiales bacterium]|nr:Bro-N domain-containing protein [Rickettsiales bacterium]
MTDLVIFENKKVRRKEHNGEWYFSVVDVVAILAETTSKDKGTYWRKLKERLILEGGDQVVTNCHGLKLTAEDGKLRETDCANLETMFRIIQSIPSPKAEPFKQWLARVGYERIKEIENPETAQQRMMEIYRKKGYDELWIKQRVQSILTRKELTDEWKTRGAIDRDYEFFTALMSQETFGITPKEHKEIKGLKRENLRDHMSNIEIALVNLGEATAKEIHIVNNTQGTDNLKVDVAKAGKIAGETREKIEMETKKKVVSLDNFLNLKNTAKIDKKENIKKISQKNKK